MHIQISRKSVFLTALLAVMVMFGSFSAVNAQTTVQFNNNLYWNMAPVSEEVKVLQQFLKDEGHYTGAITGKYLTQTYNAVVKFQNANSISPATGYFGPDTRVKANEILSKKTTPPNSVTTTQTNTTANNNVAAAVTTTTAVATTPTTASVAIAGNLILNPSMEEANGTRPNKWSIGKWGTNTATFNYPTAGFDGSKSANVTITAHTSGDAKWFFDEVAVTPGGTYTFSEHNKSNVLTNVTIQWKKANGTLTHQSLGNPAAATSWTLRTNTFTVPNDAVAMTIFHVLKTVGTLDIDNYKLVSGSKVGTPTTPTAPTAPAGQTAVNATVTSWGNWVSTSAWSTCSANTQTRTEERTRTVINGPVNGGTTPILRETRTATQTCGTASTTTNPTMPSSSAPTSSSNNTLNFPKKEWGAYVGWQESDLANFESIVGGQAKHRAVFIHWGNEKNFPTYLKPTVKDKGKTLVVFWEATNYNVGTVNQANYSYDAILNGNWDSYIAQFAAEAKAYGGEVILIPFSEMNGNWFPWSITQNGNNAQKHIDAWRKIREAFRGATNVKFGWAPNHDAVPDTAVNQFENFYPGDAYVDYVGLDGFNFNSPWMTFDQIFKEGLTKMKAYNKPVYIFSFASAEGTQKAAWIADALNVQIPKYPEIKGWIWFHEDKERDWRINSDSNALTAFKSALPLTLPL
jgi:beta-mannanase